MDATGRLDRTALKVNQAGVVVTLLVAYVVSAVWRPAALLVPLLALIMLLGTFEPRAAVFKQLYQRVLRPRGILSPRPVIESARPHNFAQALGGVVLVPASLALALGAGIVGWALAWIVLALAFVNLAFGF